MRPERSIVVLYDNDVHCAISGYPYMAGLRDEVTDTAWCALVSAGDYLQGGTAGAISNGRYVAEIMRSMAYDALTIGNHEFDYGREAMNELLCFIGAPVTCCNLRHISDGRIVFSDYVMKKMGGRKVAFVGVTTPTAVLSERYAFTDSAGQFVYDLCQEVLCQRVQSAVDNARSQGADFVVLLSHMGVDVRSHAFSSTKIIAGTHGIDVVLDGHTHEVMTNGRVANKEGKEVLVAQTGTQFAYIGKLLIKPDGSITNELIPLKQLTHRSPFVAQVTDSIIMEMEKTAARLIGSADCELNIRDESGRQGTRLHEMPVGNLVTDAYRALTGADIAITNGGGIRTAMRQGNFTYGDIMALLPFDNRLVTVEISGAMLVEVLEAASQLLPFEDGQFAQCSGMRYTIDMNAKPDSVGTLHRVRQVEVLDKKSGEYRPIDYDHHYRLATLDYCVTGGGMGNVMKNLKIQMEWNLPYSKVLIRYIEDHLHRHIGEEYSKPQGRIKIINSY